MLKAARQPLPRPLVAIKLFFGVNMAAQDAVEFSNEMLETANRLPHPQEVWDAAWNASEEKFNSAAQSGPTNKAQAEIAALVRAWDAYQSHGFLLYCRDNMEKWRQLSAVR